MSDPLSVAASITGLIALAGQLYIALDGFISNVRDAPLLAGTIQAEIKSFRNSLNALHGLLHDPTFCKSRRAALISADYVVVSFTDAVLVFSQLEANVLPLTKFTEFGVVARTQWTRKKGKLNELVGRLQWQKHTLVLQLNILGCASDIEAERNRQVLDTLITERLGKDRDMERRLELVEQQLQLTNASVCDRSSIISSRTTDSDHTIRPGDSNNANTTLASNTSFQHAFEELLNSSWVYRRNKNREEDMSMHSSVLRLSAWSILSDISLANISIIAVMSLPVQIQELWNGGWYTTNSQVPTAVAEQATEPPVFSGPYNAEVDEEDGDSHNGLKTSPDSGQQSDLSKPEDPATIYATPPKRDFGQRTAHAFVAEDQLEREDRERVYQDWLKKRAEQPAGTAERYLLELAEKGYVGKEPSQEDAVPKMPEIDQTSAANTAKAKLLGRESRELRRQRELFESGVREQAKTFQAWKGRGKGDGVASVAPSNPAASLTTAEETMLRRFSMHGVNGLTLPGRPAGVEPVGTYYCDRCGEALKEPNRARRLAESTWHVECFTCDTCNCQLTRDVSASLLDDGRLICHNCAYTCIRLGEKLKFVDGPTANIGEVSHGAETSSSLGRTKSRDINQDVFKEMLEEARRTGKKRMTPIKNDPTRKESETPERDLIDQILDEEEAQFYCKGCGEVLEEGKAFELAGNRWHIDCFRCNTCDTLLDDDPNLLLLGDGSLICNKCTYDCSACGKKIEDLAILTNDQAFHATCFKCRNCKKKIENLRYARTSQGFFCMSCHESLMARRRKKKGRAAPQDTAGGRSTPKIKDEDHDDGAQAPTSTPVAGPSSAAARPSTAVAGPSTPEIGHSISDESVVV